MTIFARCLVGLRELARYAVRNIAVCGI